MNQVVIEETSFEEVLSEMREKVAIDILIFYLKMMYDAEKKGELIR